MGTPHEWRLDSPGTGAPGLERRRSRAAAGRQFRPHQRVEQRAVHAQPGRLPAPGRGVYAEPDRVLALAGHRAAPPAPEDAKARRIALFQRVEMSPTQIAGLEAMLTAWADRRASTPTTEES